MDIVIRAACVFVFVWLVLRALGKRELGELTAFELVLLFVIGDLVQQSVTQNDTSVTAAVLAISTISLLIVMQAYTAFRWKKSRRVVDGTPGGIVHQRRNLAAPLRPEALTSHHARPAARAHGTA